MKKYYIYIGLIVIGLTLLLNQTGHIPHYIVGIGLGIGIGLEIIGVYLIKKEKI